MPRRWLLLLVLPFLAGCDYLPFGYTPIGEIRDSPGHFEGAPVRVRGKVTEITKLPLVGSKSYQLEDDTGIIRVVTEGTLPSLDTTIAIKAEMKTMAIIDQQSFGLRLQELKKLPTFGLGG